MSRAESIVAVLEEIIDRRYYYLKELDYENRTYATDYKKKHYDPLVKSLVDLLEKEFDFSEK